MIKGIVVPKMKMLCLSAYPQGIQEVCDFVSSVEHKQRFFKGDLLCKNHFYKVFEHSCVAAVCENNQAIMVKIHQLIFL